MASKDDGEVFVYDRLPYPSPINPNLTPERIAAAGLLQGWASPGPGTASLLEIGCGDGLNVIGWAAAAPGARCAGFDLSAPAIETGRVLAQAAGLGNVDLHHGDILTYPRDGEGFDYIVAHGVYSWVPAPVRLALMDLIAARLNPGGVAYVSYDVLPAAAPKQAVSAFIRDRVRDIADLDARVETGLALLRILAKSQGVGSRLKPALDRFAGSPEEMVSYFLHDWLGEFYAPISLADFAAVAAKAGLTVVGDSQPNDRFVDDLDADARNWIAAEGRDAVSRGSLLDMMRGNRVFRRTLLTRSDGTLPPVRTGIRSMRYAFAGTREEVETDGEHAVRYGSTSTMWITTSSAPLMKLLDLLHARRPAELSFAEIARQAELPPDVAEAVLRQAAGFGIIETYMIDPPFTLTPGERPRTGRLVRAMTERLGWAISLRHRRVDMEDDATRRFIALCDGTRDRDALYNDMVQSGSNEIGREALDQRIDNLASLHLLEA